MAIGAAIVLAGFILPMLTRPHEHGHRRSCNSNLGQIVKACTTYQEPNGDFFPAYWDGNRFEPMMSLTLLYPAYLDNVKVFGCPETKDRPAIRGTVTGPDRRSSFGPVSGETKCSYFYDERSHFRDVGPGQAMVVDADGQNWKDPQGNPPPYATNWKRKPRQPNHANGQNVMYFDGHVKWAETVYCSDDPKDNVFCPNGGAAVDSGQWGADTDAYLWDGVNGRAKQLD